MELRVLRYFLTVAREENITRAASILHITQPTLSRQLMQLEDELSTQLFLREKNRIVLTEDGMLLRKRAEELVELADKTEREFKQRDEVLSGEIYIGAGETYLMHHIVKVIKEFHDQYPLVQFDLHSGNGDDVKERIDRGLIDIGLVNEPIDIQKYDFIRLFDKETWGVVMRKDDALAAKDVITPDDLKDKPLIMTKRTSVQNELMHWLDANNDDLNIVCTYNLIYNAAIMVDEKIGYALTFDKLVDTSANSSLCFRPLSPALETGAVVVWKKHQVFSEAKAKFLQRLKDSLNAGNA